MPSIIRFHLFNVRKVLGFRESRGLTAYGDAKAARAKLFDKLKRFIENNPLLRDKLQFPTLNNSRRRTLVTER